VVWAAQEVGVPFQRTDAGLSYGVVKTPEYRDMNPNSEVPTIQDGELVLWESNVIVRYLCARYARDSLYPQELAARFDAERWMDWQQTTFNRAAGTAFVQWFRTPADKRDMAAIVQSVEKTQPLLALLDAHLARQAYMAGDHFTMADIPLGCDVQRWLGLPEQHPYLPNLRRWINTLLQRPGAKGVLDLPLA
jgi:glutathione S-transferase